ncbi:MAG: DUF2723 domain-containing protein, partial [Chloroflexi bacterium]|nr:DUF2723 domain-containing protein [Chloroflexota bacterium]
MRARWPHIALAAALGLVAGLFLARLLAEQWPASCIALYEPAGAAALALLTALAVVAVWLVASRITGDPPDAVPLLPLALLGVYAVQPGVNLAQAWTLLVGSLLMGLLLYTTQHARAGRLVFAGVTLLTFLLYLRTLAPGVIVGDAAEFQTILPTLGIAHPTGYPLYTLLGWLWTRMPFGEVAWRVNLLSAVCGALTVGVVYLVADRWSSPPFSTPTPPLPLKLGGRGGVRKARGGVGGSQVVAALTALAFAATPTWWDQCVMAEIYALGTLLAVTALYAVLRWGDDPARRVRWLWLAAGCMGLGLAHHRTIILVAPALLAYILLTDWRIVRRPRDWLPALPLVLLPLALYAYFPLRWPALHDGQPMTGDQFRFLVLAEGYAPALRLDAAVGTVAPDRWAIYLRLVGEQFGPAAWLALPGVLWLLARRPRLGIVTGLWYAATVLFGLAYFVPDVSVFFIPAHLVLALWIGCTLWLAVRALARWPRLQVAGLTVAALLPLALVWTNLPAADLSGETAAQDWGEMALSYPIRENAVIICDVHRLAPLNYLAHGAGRRPDLTLTMPDTEAQSREIIAQALAAGRPVYLARFVPGLEGIYALRSVGPLVEVSPDPLATPPSIEHPTDAVFGGTVRLLSYDGPGFEMRNSELGTRYTLYWQATGPIGQNLHPRLRLVDAAGRTWAEEA